MGNRNSGRWGPRDGRPTTSEAVRVTIGRLSLWGSGMAYETIDPSHWLVSCGGMRCIVRIESVRHHPAGTRRLFLCAGCEGRCAVMYANAGRLSCRRCAGLAYATQMESRACRRLRKLIGL